MRGVVIFQRAPPSLMTVKVSPVMMPLNFLSARQFDRLGKLSNYVDNEGS